jgi:hypothetical protein
MQIATKTSKNRILPMATAAPSPLRPARHILYVSSPDSRSIRCANRDKLPNASSHLRVHDLVPRDNIACERRLARNKPPSRPGAQAPDPRYRRRGNRKTADVIAASASVAIRARCAGCSHRKLSRSAVHATEWDTRDQAASSELVSCNNE